MPIVSSDGAQIYYESHGDGDPVLWIMGLGLDSRMTLMLTAAFPQFRNVVLDNRGAGRSSAPPGAYSMGQMGRDALAVLDDAGIERAHVVGMSLGGAIAQHLALDAPERVRSLTLACTWAGPNEWTRRLAEIALPMADKLGYEMLLKHTLLLIFSTRFVIEQPQMVRMFEDMGNAMVAPMEPFFSQVEAALAHDVRDRIGTLAMPVLILAGRHDIFVPTALQEELARLIPGSTLQVLDGGHAFMLEDAGTFNAALSTFFAAH